VSLDAVVSFVSPCQGHRLSLLVVVYIRLPNNSTQIKHAQQDFLSTFIPQRDRVEVVISTTLFPTCACYSAVSNGSTTVSVRVTYTHLDKTPAVYDRHRNPPGQGYPTGVLTLPYSGSQGQRSLLTRPVTLPGSGQGTLQGRIEVETV
jgi:hypothetical protein